MKMDAVQKTQLPDEEVKRSYLIPREEKFEMINCSIKGAYCKDQILPEINRLYAEAEVSRINKEYQSAIEMLQMAHQKTLELTESPCAQCVSFFQYSIKETLEIMQEDLLAMSKGLFSTTRYQLVYTKLGGIISNMNPFRNQHADVHSTQKILG